MDDNANSNIKDNSITRRVYDIGNENIMVLIVIVTIMIMISE